MTRVPWTAKLRGWAVVSFWGISLLLLGPFSLSLYLLVRNPIVIFIPASAMCWLGHKIAGLRVTTQGLEKLQPRQPYIFVANHQSWLDTTLMFVLLGGRVAFLVKKEVFRIPILNPGLDWMGCARIDRSNRQKAIESIRYAAEKIRRGQSYIVYPEGTRSPDGQMIPFKKGAFHLALEAGVPVVPVTVDGTAKVMPKGSVCAIPGPVYVTIHDPIDVAQYDSETIEELVQTAWHAVHSALPQPRSATATH